MVNHRFKSKCVKATNGRVIRSFVESLESRCMLSSSANDPIVSPMTLVVAAASSSSGIAGYTPAQIRTAYGITGDGSGQTIAIVDAYSDPNIAADLAVFDKQFGLSAPGSFAQISSNGSPRKLPAADAGWATEISLDVEWAHAIAPKANIVLVDAASDSLSSLMSAVDYARSIPGVSVVSMSWGTSEFKSETSYDSYFTTPSGHTGITFVAASGDGGASGGAEWPAVSSNVLSVGGTTMTISSSGSIASETAWNDSSGGSSSYETLGVQSAATGRTTRTSPDVSFNADPNTGFAVYDSLAYQGYVGWQEVGGTSAGAPAWAGIIAIADAARVAAKRTTLTTAQTLSDVYSIYGNSSAYSASFRDITGGSSFLGYSGGGQGRFGGRAVYVAASTGYDTLTGIGSPKASSLIAALTSNATASLKATSSTKVSSAARTTTVAVTRKAALANQREPITPANVMSLEISPQMSLPPIVEGLDLPSTQTVASTAAMSGERGSGTTESVQRLVPAIASAYPLTRMTLSIHTIEHLQFAQPLIRLSSFPAAAQEVLITSTAARIGTALEQSALAAEGELAALSAAFTGRADDMARLGATGLAFVVADVVLLSYRYGNRKKSAGIRSAFNGGSPIRLIDDERVDC
ncbi:MAG: pcp 2 [Phycisphaerales bacterium]|nr:pcp 2 [Phycisphaerales bacterium]